MNKIIANQLVNDYVTGWIHADTPEILSTLDRSCLIIESHGPTYHGLGDIKQWVNEWHQNGKIDEWTITSFFFTDNTAFFEWSFTCTIDGETSSIDGASIAKFNGEKISYIHEYRMTEPAFDYFK